MLEKLVQDLRDDILSLGKFKDDIKTDLVGSLEDEMKRIKADADDKLSNFKDDIKTDLVGILEDEMKKIKEDANDTLIDLTCNQE